MFFTAAMMMAGAATQATASSFQSISCKDSYVGLEPQWDRSDRWETYVAAGGRQRYGILVDSGAQSNIVGETWLRRFVQDNGIEHLVKWERSAASFRGVGSGAAPSTWRATFPIGISS